MDEQREPTLVVLAAGMGSRYGGLKQIAPVNDAGEGILDYSVFDAARAGFGGVVFVIRHDIEQAFREAIGDRIARHVPVRYAFQSLDGLPDGFTVPEGRTKPWGTLQATLVGAAAVPGSFAVINADDFYGRASYAVLGRHLLDGGNRGAMAGFRLRNTLSDFGSVSRGICQVDAEGRLTNIVERTAIVREGDDAADTAGGGHVPLPGDSVVSMNMWAFTPAAVPLLQNSFLAFLREHGTEPKTEAYLPEAVNGLVAQGAYAVDVLPSDSPWCGMTYPEDRPLVVAEIAKLTAAGEYPAVLWP